MKFSHQAPTWRLMLVDAVLLAAVGAVALLPLAPVYAGQRWAVAAATGFVLGVGITLLARALRCGALLTGLMVALGYLLVGPAAAASYQAVGGLLPSLDSLRTVATGVVTSWRSSLTMPIPLDGTRGELVIPFVLALTGSVLATAFLWRTRMPALAAAPVVIVFVVAAAFGTRTGGFPLLRGLLLAGLLLVWMRWRALRTVRTSWPRRVGLGLALLTVAGVAGWGLTAAVAGDGPREVLRDHVEPPLRRLEFKSPLAGYRDFYKNHKDEVLFTFSERPAGNPPVRLATMDSFDGYVWNVSSTDLINGTSAFREAPASGSGDAIDVTVGEYAAPWLPTVGTATGATLVEDGTKGAERELLLNTSTGTVAQSGGSAEGDVYRLDWQPRNESEDPTSKTADRSYPLSPMKVPAIDKLDELARDWVTEAGATTDYDVARALQRGFQSKGYFSDGIMAVREGYSPSGHGLKRLVDLVADPERMVGNEEQYASAMAYAAQRMGLPARVVLGFEQIPADKTVTGDDIEAWVEIPFEGQGWMTFDPTPRENKYPPALRKSKDPAPQPYVVQPPVLPEEPSDTQGLPPEGSGKDLGDKLWDVFLKVVAVVVVILKVLALLAPLWLILLFKWWRRRRRVRHADPLVRLSGAWRELSDHARDLGAKIPAGNTRYETSVVLASRFPTSEPAALATEADRHVFGPGMPTDDEIDAYWADVETAWKRMRKDVPWWRRLLGRFSLASVPWRRTGEAIRAGATRRGQGALARGRALTARLLRRVGK